MKPTIRDLNEALTYHLEGMYDSEKNLQRAIPIMAKNVVSTELKESLKNLEENRKDCRTKLKRIFSYLLAGPFQRSNVVMDQLLEEAENIFNYNSSQAVKEVIFIDHLLVTLHYQNSAYGAAKSMAAFLEIHAVADLLEDIMALNREAHFHLMRNSQQAMKRSQQLEHHN